MNTTENYISVLNSTLEQNLRNKLSSEESIYLKNALKSARAYQVDENKPLHNMLFSRLRKSLEEPGITLALLSMGLGQASTEFAEKRGKKSPIGKFLKKAPVMAQATVELRKFIEDNGKDLSQGDEQVKTQYEQIALGYGLGIDSKLFNDPQIVANMRKSFILWGSYGEVVKYTGIPVQLVLSGLFTLEPNAHEFVSKYWPLIDAGAIVATGALLYWRANQEMAAIREVGYNPDFLQTAPILLTSTPETQEWNIKKWVWAVNALDAVKVAAIYNLPVAWNTHLLTAALIANITDQIYHGGFNFVFRKMHQRH